MSIVTDYVYSGFVLVPVPEGCKGPHNTGWNLRDRCITAPEQLSRLSGENIGLAHAYCTPSPTCAIDIDCHDQAAVWLSGHGVDLKELEDAGDAVIIWSGKENSLKLLYRLPSGTNALESKQVPGKDGSMMLEFRCATRNGKTVQDLLPPSVHPSGSTYQWMGAGDPANPPTIPQPLLKVWMRLIQEDQRTRKSAAMAPGLHMEAETPRRVARIKDALTYINADCDRQTWRDVVWGILSTGWSCAIDLSQEWSQSAGQRYEEDAFWNLVNLYDPTLEEGHSLGTVIHHARAGGWCG